VLGVADAEQLFGALDAIASRDPAAALRAAATLAESGRDPGQVLRDLEVHARELLTVQVLDEVPPELRVTPERDRRLVEQAKALTSTDAVRLLDLVSAALEATANGAQARIQLELVLIKAAAPEVDPSTSALLARIERLEAGAPPVAPSVETPPRAPEPVVPADLGGVTDSWPAVVEAVKQGNAMLAALLADARPVAVSDRELTLAFPSGAAFLKRKAEQEDHRRVAADAFRKITGRSLALRYELRDVEQPENGDQATLSGEELVRRFMEEFDAEEIHDDEREAQ
jgi:DNA polymerase III subunit gamma/tau